MYRTVWEEHKSVEFRTRVHAYVYQNNVFQTVGTLRNVLQLKVGTWRSKHNYFIS